MKTMARFLLNFVLPLVLIYLSSPPAQADPILSVQPPTSTVQPGAAFDVDVSIANVSDLYAFQFDLSFDPAIVSATAVTEGSFLATGGGTVFVPGTIDNALGTIVFTADSLISATLGVNGSGVLATISLQAIAIGTSPLGLSSVTLLDSSLIDISTEAVDDGTVSVVPEPASFLLLVSGLGVLCLIGRRKRE